MAAAAAAAAVTVTVMLSCNRGGSDDAPAFVQLRACVPPDARDDSRGSASRKVLVGLLVLLLLLLLLPVVAVEQDRSFVLKNAVERGFLKRKILVQKNPAWTLGPSLASCLLLTRGIPLLTFL